MTPEQFAYWLNGFAELNKDPPTPEQWLSIKQHLQTVFYKVTPSAPGSIPPNIQPVFKPGDYSQPIQPIAIC